MLNHGTIANTLENLVLDAKARTRLVTILQVFMWMGVGISLLTWLYVILVPESPWHSLMRPELISNGVMILIVLVVVLFIGGYDSSPAKTGSHLFIVYILGVVLSMVLLYVTDPGLIPRPENINFLGITQIFQFIVYLVVSFGMAAFPAFISIFLSRGIINLFGRS